MHELRRREVDHREGDTHPAGDADEIGVDHEERHHHEEAEHARKHEVIDGRNAERTERVDLLGDLHAAQFGRESGAGAACHDDAGHERAQLAQHAVPDEVRDVVAGAEALEHDDAEEGDDHADEQRDQRYDGECAGTVRLHDHPELAPAHAHPPAQQLGAALDHLARERDRDLRRIPRGEPGEPKPRDR